MAQRGKKTGSEQSGFTPLGDGSHLSPDAESKEIKHDKVSAEDVRRTLERRREVERQKIRERNAQRSPIFSIARVAITVVTLLIAVGSLMYVAGTSGAYEEELAANESALTDAQSRSDGLDKDTELAVDADTLTNNLVLARERGNKITDIQNAMADTRIMTNMNDDQGKAITEDYALQVDQLRSYITRGAQVGGNFAPHQRWIAPVVTTADPETGNPVAESLDSSSYTWSMHDTLSVDSQGKVVPVIWTAHYTEGDNAGQLIAWVTSNFDVDAGMFRDFTFGLTPFGAELLDSTASLEYQEFNEDDKTQRKAERDLQNLIDMQESQNEDAAEVDLDEAQNNADQREADADQGTTDQDTNDQGTTDQQDGEQQDNTGQDNTAQDNTAQGESGTNDQDSAVTEEQE